MAINEITHEGAPAFDAAVIHNSMWPAAVISFGLGLSAVWTCIIGYEIAKLILPI